MILLLVSTMVVSGDTGRGMLDKNKGKRKEEIRHVALH